MLLNECLFYDQVELNVLIILQPVLRTQPIHAIHAIHTWTVCLMWNGWQTCIVWIYGMLLDRFYAPV